MINRRTFLQAAGAGTVVVAGGSVWRASDRGVLSADTGIAYEPWTSWRTDMKEGPLALVRAGILAANPHNTQPWLFEVSESRVDLCADTSRHLGAFDPFRREMVIGLGCAVENMVLAAEAVGYAPQVTLAGGDVDALREGDEPVRVARIALEPQAKKSGSLFEAIPHRHTNRNPYDVNRSLPPEVLAGFEEPADEEDLKVVLLTEKSEREALGELVIGATEAIIGDTIMVEDSERWYRHSRREIERFRDGPTLDAAGLSPLRTAVAKMLPRPSAEANHEYWLAATRDVHVPTAAAFGLIAVRELYDINQNLQAGRLWQRMHLWATTQGVAMQPLNQPVEYVDRELELGLPPRMAEALDDISGNPSWKPTFVFRAGYPVRTGALSPRRAVVDVLA